MRSLLAVAILAGGCGPSVAPDDAAPVIDVGADAGVSPEIAACESAVDNVISACSASAHPAARRLCVERAYRAACATGRPDVIRAVADCLASSPCETARDPGADAACVTSAVMASQDDAQVALDHAWCTCSPTETGCPDVPVLTSSETAMLSDSDAQRVTDCLAGCAMPAFCIGITTLGAAIHMCDMLLP